MRAAIKLAFVSLLLVMVGPTPAGAEASAKQVDCMVQPAGNIITPFMANRINELRPQYIEAARAKNVSWLVLPPIHYRETALRRDNPSNGQGIFQLYSYVKQTGKKFAPSPGTPVAPTEFVRQAELALGHLIGKAPASLANPEESTVAWAYFGYNGRSQAYYRQATRLQYKYPFEGSPYVYNMFDTAHTGKLYLIQQDGGRLTDTLDTRPGAFTIYYELLRQCQPERVPEVRSNTPTTGPTPEQAPNPFSGEVVPRLPAEGTFPFPWFAFGALVSAPVLMLTYGIARRNPVGATAWVMAAVMAPAFIHFDDLTVQSWPFLGDLTLGRGAMLVAGIAVAALLLAGFVRTLEDSTRIHTKKDLALDVIRWSSRWVTRNYKMLRQVIAVALGMVLVYRFTATGSPAEQHFTLRAQLLMVVVVLGNTWLMNRRNGNGNVTK